MDSLPYADADSTLRAIAGQAEGFGRFAIGGLHGPLFCVTSLSDDGPGSLREACRRPGPGWIVFEVSGVIQLSSYLSVGSYKTIDGRGERVKLTGNGLRLKECENVIICNMEFEGGRGHDVDGIQIKPNSKHIWIDRCSFKDYDDGLIDITRGSTDITVSRTRQRHPRVRFGKVHLYNNYTRNWDIYAVCASVEAQIYSQCNIYEAGMKKKTFEFYTEKAADREEPRSGLIRSEGDLFLDGAQPCLLTGIGQDSLFHPSEFYQTWTMEAPSDSLKHVLQICTGWQPIPRPP
ncbi:Pectin lyase-like superfamily protein isoform 3 [Theobroma cacao]|uniref:Pectate lyase n=1 Tax=Theobroma cacao TaxID=3641 RepID=A0A061FNB1_THECC|nr:Pectin lyase-like superfamily protein isoform 3 [Theobroma cacao]